MSPRDHARDKMIKRASYQPLRPVTFRMLSVNSLSPPFVPPRFSPPPPCTTSPHPCAGGLLSPQHMLQRKISLKYYSPCPVLPLRNPKWRHTGGWSMNMSTHVKDRATWHPLVHRPHFPPLHRWLGLVSQCSASWGWALGLRGVPSAQFPSSGVPKVPCPSPFWFLVPLSLMS